VTAGSDLTIYGVTGDGYVVYYDSTHGDLGVVSINGGTPTTIAAAVGSTFYVVPSEKGVLVWTNVDANDVGELVMWTAALGARSVSGASRALAGGIDPTAAYIVYSTNSDEGAGTFDLMGATTDGSESDTIASALSGATVEMVNSYAVVDMIVGTASATSQLVSVVLGSWIHHPCAMPISTTGSRLLGLDTAGTSALYLYQNYPVVCSTDGSTANYVTGGLSVSSALFAPDGSAVLYSSSDQTSITRVTVSTLDTTVLATDGIGLTLQTVSPDGNTMLATGYVPVATVDLLYGSAVSPTGVSAVTAEMGIGLVGFTGDSSQLVYVSGVASGTGTLTSLPTAGGSARIIDTAAFTWATSGNTKIVFNDNYTTSAADLKVIDLSNAASSPSLIAAQVQPVFALTADRNTLVYSSSAGIYAVPVP